MHVQLEYEILRMLSLSPIDHFNYTYAIAQSPVTRKLNVFWFERSQIETIFSLTCTINGDS